MLKLLTFSSVFIIAAGCGGSGGSGGSSGKSTQDELLRAMIGVLNTGDTKALTKLFPTKADLKSSFKCDSPEARAKLNESFLEEKETVLKHLPEGLELISKDKEVTYIGFGLIDKKAFPVGSRMEGCETITAFAMAEGRLKVSLTNRGETEKKTYQITMVRLNEKYFVVESGSDNFGYSGLFGRAPSLQIRTKLQMGSIHEGLSIYRVTHRGYPNTLEDGKDYFSTGKVPTDAWGRPFTYQQDDGGRGYILTSLGKDGRAGGEGLDADIVCRRDRYARGPCPMSTNSKISTY